MDQVPHYVYFFRRRYRVDGPDAPKMTTDLVVIQSTVPLTQIEAVKRMRELTFRPFVEYEQIITIPDCDFRLDTWEDSIESCADVNCFFPVNRIFFDGELFPVILAGIEFDRINPPARPPAPGLPG